MALSEREGSDAGPSGERLQEFACRQRRPFLNTELGMSLQVAAHHRETEAIAGPLRHPFRTAEHDVVAEGVGGRRELLLERRPDTPLVVDAERIGVRRRKTR